ncbi:MAG TPA: hypothetical protein VNO55_32960 [Polyangia bacterium]|nr:hypothetical protein [Polyangia bacterium]
MALFALAGVFGCSGAGRDAALGSATDPLNLTPSLSNFTIYGANSVSIATGALVGEGDVGVSTVGSGPFLVPGAALTVAGLARVEPNRNLLADSVSLGSQALVGDVETDHLINRGATLGKVLPLPNMPALPVAAAVSPGTQDLTIMANTTVMIPANGKFNRVMVQSGAVARFAGGIYQVRDLTVADNARLELLARTEFHLAGRLALGKGTFFGPRPGLALSASDGRIEVSGINGASGSLSDSPKAAVLGANAQVTALILVPKGLLSMGAGVLARGAFFARDISVGDNAQAHFQDGFAPGVVTDPLQFEVASDWRVGKGTVQSLAITPAHTQGLGALAVAAPDGPVRLDSKRISSPHPALATLEAGSKVSLDFLLPAKQANAMFFGTLQLLISVPSRKISNVSLGQVALTGRRTGIFTTVHFTIPEAVATALQGAVFTDLTFSISLDVPAHSPGTYLFDNLRLKNGRLPPPPTSVGQIVEGSSILLEASKTVSPPANNPAAQSFAPGVIQIPQRFAVVLGNAGTGTASFEYRLGTGAAVVCQYNAAASVGGQAYDFASCAGGAGAGDLVPADFVRLTVVNSDPAAGKTKIKAQIALNPTGDDLATGLPPIPTFFGTTGDEVRAALDAFVQQQRNWNIDDAEVVRLPTPNIPVGFPVEQNGNVVSTPPAANDPPFTLSSRLTGTDMVDAGWHVNGNISAPIGASGSRDTHIDIDIGADAWLLTAKLNDVVGVNGFVDTHTPAFDGHTVPASTGTAQFCYKYLGFAQACAGPFDGTAGLNQQIVDISPTVTFFSLDYWVFHIGSSANLDIKAALTGGFTPNGFAIAFDPKLTLAANVEGGLSLGPFVGAGLFASFTLLDVAAPISASVDASLNADPRFCSVHLSETLSGQATVSTGGGTLGYYIQGGLCCGCFIDVCWRDEGSLFSWNGFSTSFNILPKTPLADQDFPLPKELCTPTGNADGGISYPLVDENFNPGDISFVEADFTRTFISTDGKIHPDVHIDCTQFVWSSSDPSDVISSTAVFGMSPFGVPNCYTKIRYGTTGPRTLTVTVTDPLLGSGIGSRQVIVTDGDPATAPVVTIATPPPFDANGGGCSGPMASGTFVDPSGLDVGLEWFGGRFDSSGLHLTSEGTGSSVKLSGAGSDIVRLVGTNAASPPQPAMMEIPVQYTCVK